MQTYDCGASMYECEANGLLDSLDKMNPLDVLHCKHDDCQWLFRSWLKSNNKVGRIAYMPKSRMWSMYFKG